jgi:polyhydroxyalkanoate synthesis regulator phasin
MVLDGLRGYLQLANGLSDVTRERARAAAKTLVAQGEARVGAVVPTSVQAQVTTLTEDLLATSKANRHLLVNLVRGEVERSVARLGLASAQELDAAVRRSKGLERRVAELEDELNRSATARKAANTKARKATAKKSTAKKKTTAKKTTAKKTTATTTAAPDPAATATTATTTAGS